MTTQIDQRTDVLIGHVQGCAVLASYMDDGKLYHAAMTWQGAQVVTDADGYIELFGGRDIGITDWRIVRDLVQCDVIEELTTLALAHQWIAPIDGYTSETEDIPFVPIPPASQPFEQSHPSSDAEIAAFIKKILPLVRAENAANAAKEQTS